MSKKQKKIVESRFTLPGDELEVQVLGYAHGVHCMPTVIFAGAKQLAGGHKDGDGFLMRQPDPKEEEVTGAAQHIADLFIHDSSQSGIPTTNDAGLFREHFVKSYLAGYRFSLFAIRHGLIDLLSELPESKHHELLYRFSWEKINQRSVYADGSNAEHDTLMDDGVEAIKTIYKQYQTDGALPIETIETKEQIVQRLIDGLWREIELRKQSPGIGDHIEATSGDGYTIEADCVPDPGLVKPDPAKGKPVVLAISIFDPNGKRLMENNKLVD